MNILKTKEGKQLVAKVGVKKAKKLIRQEMTSKMVSHIERQGLSAGRAQRTRQTRELLTRPTVGIDNSIRYADLGESFGVPMKLRRAVRVLKSKRLRDAAPVGSQDVELRRKAIRSVQIRKGVGDKIKMSKSGGGSVDLNMPDMQSRTSQGRDIPRSSQMGATRDATSKVAFKRRLGNNPLIKMMYGGLDREITLRGEDEQMKAAKEGGKALRRTHKKTGIIRSIRNSIGESFGAPMKQKRAERVMKTYRKRLSSKSRDGRSFETADFDKAFRSSQIRKGKGPKIRIPTSPEGGAKNPENIRTFLGVDRPSAPEQGEEGVIGSIRANIGTEMKKRANSDSSNKKISDKGKREQRLAKILSSHGFRRSGKALRRSKPN